MKNKIAFALSITLIILSLYMGVSDISDLKSCGDSCSAIHNSSFGTLYDIPLAFYGSLALFIFVLLTYIFNFKKFSSILLISLVGGELYFTIIQFTFLNNLCIFCLIFALGLFLLFYLNQINLEKTLGAIAVAGITHFIFFPPLSINDNNLFFSLKKEKKQPQITIYASPSCTHCETAIDFLKNFCCTTNDNIKVYVKPVSLSAKDKQKAIKSLCQSLFNSQGNPLEKRIAENFVIKNEKELKDRVGYIRTPYIEISYENKTETFLGWDQNQFLNYLSSIQKNNTLKKIHNNAVPFENYLKIKTPLLQKEKNICTQKSKECLL